MTNQPCNIDIPPKPWRRPRAAADIETGVWLSRTYGKRYVGPADVARVLAAAGVRFLMVGTHAVNAYSGQPRSATDVDVIVRAPRAAAKAVAAAFPELKRSDTPAGIRFADARLEAVDLIDLAKSKLFRRLHHAPRRLRVKGATLYLPTLEGLLASKFHAMHTAERGWGDRSLDAADFMQVVDVNPRINLSALAHFGELIVAGGGAKILACVADARAKRRLNF